MTRTEIIITVCVCVCVCVRACVHTCKRAINLCTFFFWFNTIKAWVVSLYVSRDHRL